MRGERGQKSAGDLRGYKNMAFEGGHRIPFVARWPDGIPAGSVSDEMICLTDFYASFAAHLGAALKPGEAEDSFDVMLPLLGKSASAPRPHLVNDTGGHSAKIGDFAVRSGDWKLVIIAPPDPDAYSRKRPIPEDAVDGRLLFNLEDDPAEERNVVTSHPKVAARLEDLLREIRESGSRSVPGVDW